MQTKQYPAGEATQDFTRIPNTIQQTGCNVISDISTFAHIQTHITVTFPPLKVSLYQPFLVGEGGGGGGFNLCRNRLYQLIG